MASQIVQLKIAGLYTNNQYLTQVPEGALTECIDYIHDRKGILEKRRGYKIYGDALTLDTDRAKQLFSYKGAIFRHFNDKIQVDNGSGTFTEYSDTFTEVTSEQRMKSVEFQGNLYVTTNEGVKKLDAASNAELTTRDFKLAGGLKALHVQGTTTGVSGYLPNLKKVAYRITWSYKDGNENVITGVPSEITITENATGSSTNVELTFPIPSAATSDHYYQIWRSAYVDNTQEPADEEQLVIEEFPTAQQLADSEVVIEDITPEEFREGGAYLYTNAFSGEGIAQANERPPLAIDITEYKNYMFYANTKTSHKFTFYLLSVDDLYDGETKLLVSNGTISREYTFDTTEDTAIGQIKRETAFTTAINVEDTAKSIIRVVNSDTSGIVDAFYLSGPTDTPGYILFEKKDLTDEEFFVGIKGGDFEEFNIPFAQVNSFDSTTTGTTVTISAKSQTFDSTADVNTGTDVITIVGHSLFTGQEIEAGGTLPTGITSGTKYYVYRLTNDTFQLCLTKAETKKTTPTVVDITATAVGSGTFTETHSLITGDNIEIINSTTTPSINSRYDVTVLSSTTFSIVVGTAVTVSGTGDYFKTNITSSNEERPNRVYYSKFQQPEAVPALNYFDVGAKDKEIRRIIGLRDSLFIFKDDGIYRLSGESPQNFTVFSFDLSAFIKGPDTAQVLNNQIYALASSGVIIVSDTGVIKISEPINNQILELFKNTSIESISFGVASESDTAYYLYTPTARNDTSATVCFRWSTDTTSWTKLNRSQTCGIVNFADDKIYLGASDTNYIEQERKNFDRTDFADREYSVSLLANGISGTTINNLSSYVNLSMGDVLEQVQYLTRSQVNLTLRKLDIDLLSKRAVTITVGSTTSFNLTSHNFNTGDWVKISDVTGTAGPILNGAFKVTVLDADNFTINVNSAVYNAIGGNVRYSFIKNHEVNIGENINLKLSSIAQKLQLFFSDSFSDLNTKTGFYGTGSSFCYDDSFSYGTFELVQEAYNLVIDRLNETSELFSTDYKLSEGTVSYEEPITSVNKVTRIVQLFRQREFLEGPLTIYKGFGSTTTWTPNHAGDPSLQKRVIDGTIIVDDQNFSFAETAYSSDLIGGFKGVTVNGEGTGIFGADLYAVEAFGGEAPSTPIRTLIGRDHTRFRYLSPRVSHSVARENIKIFGLSLTIEQVSQRAYRGIR